MAGGRQRTRRIHRGSKEPREGTVWMPSSLISFRIKARETSSEVQSSIPHPQLLVSNHSGVGEEALRALQGFAEKLRAGKTTKI